MTAIVLSRREARVLPPLTRREGDLGLGHTAVVYFTHGEPELYDPRGWIAQFREFDEQRIPFVPWLVRPLFLYQLRRHYLIVGKSGHSGMHRRMLRSLEGAFRERGDASTRFYLSFLDDDPRPDAAVIQALNEGASRIVVAEVFLTISNHTAEGEELVEALRVEERFGVAVCYTGPFHDSDELQQVFVERANANLGGCEQSEVGVLLVGHGQPVEWDEEWPTETGQEISFREQILARLERAGYDRDKLGMAWMEFREPQPADVVARFVAAGARRVLYFAASISADAIHSQYDIPALVDRATVPEGVTCVNLGAWNDDPLVIRAIEARILAHVAAEGDG